jgi:hypothetical protein
VSVIQLRDHLAELSLLAPDAGEGKLCISLGEPRGQPLGSERRKPHIHSGYFRPSLDV